MESVIIVRYLFDENKFITYVKEISKNYYVFIYDNSPEKIVFTEPNIFYFSESRNIGLMAGINKCLREAIKMGCTKCIYFDQDSNININLIKQLFNSYDKLKDLDNDTFAVGPLPMVDLIKPYPVRVTGTVFEHYFKTTEIITSGMTFNPNDVENIGWFRDDFYVDWGDYELCWRAIKHGKNVYIDSDIHMLHEVGVNYINIFKRIIPISSPLRNYYQTRNVTYSLLHGLTPYNRWLALYYFARRFINVCINVFFIAPRYKRLVYSFKGYIDGIKGKLGGYKD